MGTTLVEAERLLTSRDVQALLGVVVERFEPSDERGRFTFVCFEARGTRPAVAWEMVSLGAVPTGGRCDVPFVSVAVRADRDAPRPRRTVEAQWEQCGHKFALTYTCVVDADDDETADRATGKRAGIAALARVVSDRVPALPSPA